jgi:GAF domain-containing protein
METMHDMSPVNVHAPPPPPPLPPPPAADPGDVSQTEKERRHLAVLYQICKRCMSVDNLNDLDALLLNVLERTVPFDRGFISYQLPTGDWKLVMSPKGDRWERELIQQLLVAAFASDAPVSIPDSHHDQRLGAPNGSADSRLLVPLRSGTSPIGTIFLLSTDVDGFANDSAEFLVLFADVAALAILNCARFSGE